MGDVTQVLTGSGGIVSVAPLNTALPTSTAAALNAAFADVGLVSEDGVSINATADYLEIKSWDGSTVRKPRTSFDPTVSFVMLETNQESLELYWSGSTVQANTGESKIEIVPFATDRRSFVIDVNDGTRVTRYVLPVAEVTERQEIAHRPDQPVAYGVTLTAYPDGDGTAIYEYIDEDLTAS